MSSSGPEGPAAAVVKGKVAEAREGMGGESDHAKGDRLRKGEDTAPFARPQAQERITAALDKDQTTKEPSIIPQEARQALKSDQEYSLNIPKRH
ncbi:hypothetical protein COCOBI_13-1750 [Coccomyxa sp. Obi]|nr:hypothetical protein COCOBI_13-1750 [Coccomyxa sp. Obi]